MSSSPRPTEENRRYPARPIVGVSAVVLRHETVLLVRRGREPMRGEWSLPGGALQLGETLSEGVEREVMEETGVRVLARSILGTVDRILRDDAGAVQFHYVLVDWACEPVDNDAVPVAGDDATAAAWVPLDEAPQGEYRLSAMALEMVERARVSGSQCEEVGP